MVLFRKLHEEQERERLGEYERAIARVRNYSRAELGIAYLTLSDNPHHPALEGVRVLRKPEVSITWWEGRQLSPSYFDTVPEAPTSGVRAYALDCSKEELLAILGDERVRTTFENFVMF